MPKGRKKIDDLDRPLCVPPIEFCDSKLSMAPMKKRGLHPVLRWEGLAANAKPRLFGILVFGVVMYPSA